VSLIPTLSAGAHIISNGLQAGIPSYIVEKSIRHREERIKSCINAFKAGVSIAMGTDAGTPFNLHGNNAFELSELYATGMTPHEIIISATAAAAKALKISDITGTIEIGKQSDLLILKTNPLKDIKVLQQRQTIADIHIAGRSIFAENNFQMALESNI
jgi:imidazolonepropionase-like amidohydrolase